MPSQDEYGKKPPRFSNPNNYFTSERLFPNMFAQAHALDLHDVHSCVLFVIIFETQDRVHQNQKHTIRIIVILLPYHYLHGLSLWQSVVSSGYHHFHASMGSDTIRKMSMRARAGKPTKLQTPFVARYGWMKKIPHSPRQQGFLLMLKGISYPLSSEDTSSTSMFLFISPRTLHQYTKRTLS